jgi:nucleosome assembly protein 1-like 1
VQGKVTDFAEFTGQYDETFKEISTIVAGITKSAKDKERDEEEAKEHTPTDVAHLKGVSGIPDFWSTAIKNNQMMLQYIREKDREVLPHLTNVFVTETLAPQKSINIELTFSENEWFTNEKLTLKVLFKKDQEDEIQESEGCLIDWKDGKDLTKKKIKKKQKNKKTGETRTIVKSVPADSFFNAFESRKAPETKDSDDEDEETEKLLDALDETMQVAMDFNDLYSFEALEYYLNFGQSAADFLDMHGGSDDDNDEGSGDDEKPKKAKKEKKGGEEGKEQECK